MKSKRLVFKKFFSVFVSLLIFVSSEARAQGGADYESFLNNCLAGNQATCPGGDQNCCMREALGRSSDPTVSGNAGDLSDEALQNYRNFVNSCMSNGLYDCQSVDSEGNRTPLIGDELQACCRREGFAQANPYAFDADNYANNQSDDICDNEAARNDGEIGAQVDSYCSAAEAHKKSAIANTALAVAWLAPLATCASECSTIPAGGNFACSKVSTVIGLVDAGTALTIQEEMSEIQAGLAVLQVGASFDAFGGATGLYDWFASGGGPGSGPGDFLATAPDKANTGTWSNQIKDKTYEGIGPSGGDVPMMEQLQADTKLLSNPPEGATLGPDGNWTGTDAGKLNDAQKRVTEAKGEFNKFSENHEAAKQEQKAACVAAVMAAAKIAINGIGAKKNFDKEDDNEEEAKKLLTERQDDISNLPADQQISLRLSQRGTGTTGSRTINSNRGGGGNSSDLPSPFGECQDPTEVCAIAADPALGPFLTNPSIRSAGANLDDLINEAVANKSTPGELISGALGGGASAQQVAAAKQIFDGVAERAGERLGLGGSSLASSTYSGGGGKSASSGKKGNALSRGLANLFNKGKKLLSGGTNEQNFSGLTYDQIFRNRSLSLFVRHETKLKSAAKKDLVTSLPWATPYNITVTEE